jgi:hypothetical protein
MPASEVSPLFIPADHEVTDIQRTAVIPSRRRGTCFVTDLKALRRTGRGKYPLHCLQFHSLSRASHFSLLVQRKDNQKKAHPVVAPGALRRVRRFRGIFRQYIHVLVEKRAASCRAPCGPDPRTPPLTGAPADQDQQRLRHCLDMLIALFFIRNSWGNLRCPHGSKTSRIAACTERLMAWVPAFAGMTSTASGFCPSINPPAYLQEKNSPQTETHHTAWGRHHDDD